MPDLRSSTPDLAATESLLTDALRGRFQVDGEWSFARERIVEWRDVDAFRHANHTACLLWFEAARNLYLEAVGLPRHSVDTPGPVMMSLETRYLRPLAYHDKVLVTARIRSMRRRSFVMDYAAWGEAGCHATCTAVLVLMINATGEKVAIPDAVRAAIQALDNPLEEIS